MSKNKNIERPVVVAVEGLDYFHLLLNQIKNRPEFSDVQLWDFREDLSLDQNLKTLTTERYFVQGRVRSLGIIRDIEDSLSIQEQSLRGLFGRFRLPVPATNQKVTKGRPNTGYLLVPHDKQSGCLENACIEACALPAPRIACADAYLACIEQCLGTPLSSNKRAKVKVHALIASHNSPAMTLGQSAIPGVGLWDFTHPSLAVMLEFIDEMQKA
jgi:hypothetical protein